MPTLPTIEFRSSRPFSRTMCPLWAMLCANNPYCGTRAGERLVDRVRRVAATLVPHMWAWRGYFEGVCAPRSTPHTTPWGVADYDVVRSAASAPVAHNRTLRDRRVVAITTRPRPRRARCGPRSRWGDREGRAERELHAEPTVVLREATTVRVSVRASSQSVEATRRADAHLLATSARRRRF